ncbi:MAG: hypothetical protein ACRCUP_03575 [Mycoplasmatales bacterium]
MPIIKIYSTEKPNKSIKVEEFVTEKLLEKFMVDIDKVKIFHINVEGDDEQRTIIEWTLVRGRNVNKAETAAALYECYQKYYTRDADVIIHEITTEDVYFKGTIPLIFK